MERMFSALMLASIATLAVPLLTHQGGSSITPLDVTGLEARAEIAAHDLAAYLERQGYELGAAQLMALGGGVDAYPPLGWSPLDPQGYGAALSSTPQG